MSMAPSSPSAGSDSERGTPQSTINSRLLASAFGAAVTAVSMTPFDVVKTRLQVKTPSESLFHHMPSTVAARTAYLGRTLWRGTLPSLLNNIPSQITYLLSYDLLRRKLYDVSQTRHISGPDFYVPLVSGSLSRTLTTTLYLPMELAKVQMQVSNEAGSLTNVLAQTMRQCGVQGLWRGLNISLMRDIPFSAFYWVFYENTRRAITGGRGMGDRSQTNSGLSEFGLSFVSGLFSGILAAVVTNPFDVVKSRIQTSELPCIQHPQPSNTHIPGTFLSLYQTEGVSSFFRGLGVRCLRVGPACGIMIGSYELLDQVLAAR